MLKINLALCRLDWFGSLEVDWKALLPRGTCDTLFLPWDWPRSRSPICGESELHLLACDFLQGDEPDKDDRGTKDVPIDRLRLALDGSNRLGEVSG